MGKDEPKVGPEAERRPYGETDDVGGDVIGNGRVEPKDLMGHGQAQQGQAKADRAHADEKREFAPGMRATGVPKGPVAVAQP